MQYCKYWWHINRNRHAENHSWSYYSKTLSVSADFKQHFGSLKASSIYTYLSQKTPLSVLPIPAMLYCIIMKSNMAAIMNMSLLKYVTIMLTLAYPRFSSHISDLRTKKVIIRKFCKNELIDWCLILTPDVENGYFLCILGLNSTKYHWKMQLSLNYCSGNNGTFIISSILFPFPTKYLCSVVGKSFVYP